MFSFGRKPKKTETIACFEFVQHTITLGESEWNEISQLFAAILGDEFIGDYRVSVPNMKLVTVILAINLEILQNHSPFFNHQSGRAKRIDYWSTFSFLTDFYKEVNGNKVEDNLKKMRVYQQAFTMAMNSKINPFGQIGGLFIMDIFNHRVPERLLIDGSLNAVIHSPVSDAIKLVSAESLLFWSEFTKKFSLEISPVESSW